MRVCVEERGEGRESRGGGERREHREQKRVEERGEGRGGKRRSRITSISIKCGIMYKYKNELK